MKMNKKGFTLIELLIVVAIIAILAAIAIPQFAQYRIKGYNAAASSDIRNGKTSEEALFADFQGYGISATTAAGGSGGGGAIVSVSPAFITFTDISTGTPVRSISTSLSNGVALLANSIAFASPSRAANYTIFAKHTQGDRVFAGDSDDTVLRWKSGTAGTALAAGDSIASTSGGDITAAYINTL